MEERSSRHDPYAKPLKTEQVSRELLAMFRMVMGFLLLLVGGGVAMWDLVTIIELVLSSSPPGIVQVITQQLSQASPGDKLPQWREVLPVAGYVLSFLLMALAVGIASMFIKGGVTLLQPNIHHVLKQLARQIRASKT